MDYIIHNFKICESAENYKSSKIFLNFFENVFLKESQNSQNLKLFAVKV